MAASLAATMAWFVPSDANTAGYDGTTPFLCIPTAVAECVREGECRPGTAESENLPDFFRIDLKHKTIRAGDTGRLSPVERINRSSNQLSLYGSESDRSWVLLISEKTGRMSASVTGDGESFVIFGVCPRP
jgi:hypothetical protein